MLQFPSTLWLRERGRGVEKIEGQPMQRGSSSYVGGHRQRGDRILLLVTEVAFRNPDRLSRITVLSVI